MIAQTATTKEIRVIGFAFFKERLFKSFTNIGKKIKLDTLNSKLEIRNIYTTFLYRHTARVLSNTARTSREKNCRLISLNSDPFRRIIRITSIK